MGLFLLYHVGVAGFVGVYFYLLSHVVYWQVIDLGQQVAGVTKHAASSVTSWVSSNWQLWPHSSKDKDEGNKSEKQQKLLPGPRSPQTVQPTTQPLQITSTTSIKSSGAGERKRHAITFPMGGSNNGDVPQSSTGQQPSDTSADSDGSNYKHLLPNLHLHPPSSVDLKQVVQAWGWGRGAGDKGKGRSAGRSSHDGDRTQTHGSDADTDADVSDSEDLRQLQARDVVNQRQSTTPSASDSDESVDTGDGEEQVDAQLASGVEHRATGQETDEEAEAHPQRPHVTAAAATLGMNASTTSLGSTLDLTDGSGSSKPAPAQQQQDAATTESARVHVNAEQGVQSHPLTSLDTSIMETTDLPVASSRDDGGENLSQDFLQQEQANTAAAAAASQLASDAAHAASVSNSSGTGTSTQQPSKPNAADPLSQAATNPAPAVQTGQTDGSRVSSPNTGGPTPGSWYAVTPATDNSKLAGSVQPASQVAEAPGRQPTADDDDNRDDQEPEVTVSHGKRPGEAGSPGVPGAGRGGSSVKEEIDAKLGQSSNGSSNDSSHKADRPHHVTHSSTRDANKNGGNE